MITLATLVASAVALSGQPCAGITNTNNTAAWKRPHTNTVTTTYTDNGTYLEFRKQVLRGLTLEALKRAEDALQIGYNSPKTIVVCA